MLNCKIELCFWKKNSIKLDQVVQNRKKND